MTFIYKKSDLTIPEILRFVLQFKKSGKLTIKSPDNNTYLYCSPDSLDSIIHPFAHLKIGTILHNRDLISEKELNRALKQQAELKKPIGQILIQLNLISSPYLNKMLLFQLEEILLSACYFDPEEVIFAETNEDEGYPSAIFPEKSYILLPAIDKIVIKSKRIQEYKIKFAHRKSMYKIIANEKDKAKFSNKEEYDHIFSLIDQNLTTGDLVTLSKLGIFKTLEVLNNMIDLRLVRFLDE